MNAPHEIFIKKAMHGHLPPVEIHMSEAKITLNDPLSGITKTFDPQDESFRSRFAGLYGLWRSTYATERTMSHD